MKLWLAGLLAVSTAAPYGAAAAPATCTMSGVVELPVTMRGLRPTVTARINDHDAVFLVDSGAFFSVISPGVAREFGLSLQPAPMGLRMTGVGGDASLQIARVTFGIAGQSIPNIEFLVGGTEVGLAGVLGQNLLGLADAEYDLPHGLVRLVRTAHCEKANLAYWVQPGAVYSRMPIDDLRLAGFHTIGTVIVNGTRVRAMFDTGAAATILNSGVAFRAGLRRDMPGAQDGGHSFGFGSRPIETWIAPVASIKIGDEELRNSRIRVGDLGPVDMLIGADFFISHRVFVSNALRKLFFSYTGGPVFNLGAHLQDSAADAAAAPPVADAEPRTAAEFSRRGAVAAARNDHAHAIADFTRAIADTPNEPHYLRQRAEAYADSGQEDRAAADVETMIGLAPRDVWARMERARFRLAHDLKPAAKADLDVATAAAAPASDDRFAMAGMYQAADAPEQAIAELDRWIPNHPADARRPEALNARCWLRATLDRDLPQALVDCNEALRLRPRRADILDSRGLVRLRMGDLSRAIADYDAALAIVPLTAWSLYGRGTARLAQGKVAAGNADIAAAVAIDSGITETARKYGITR